MQRFRGQHRGLTPHEVQSLLHRRGLSLAEYAAGTGIRPRTLYGHVERFGITPYRPAPKEKAEHVPLWEDHLRQRLRDPRCKLPNADELRQR